MMKLVSSKIAVVALVACVVPALAGEALAGGVTAAGLTAGGLEPAGVRNCTWCHGTSGQGYPVAPGLAAQRYQYIENQLVSFHQHTRDNPFSRQYMWGAAANLSPRRARDLSVYFASLPAKAANDGDRSVAAAGRALYEDGDPEANTVACAVCHGPNAEGIRQIPRLAGLSYFYLKRRLRQWGQGYHVAAEAPMPLVASRLTPYEIEALASYLSFVK